MLSHTIYEEHPDSDWIVFVHGTGGSHRTFKRQIEPFKAQYNLLLLDLRDHGESKNLPIDKEAFNIEYVSQDIVDLMDGLGIEKAHFIGVSLGSVFVRLVEEIAPEKVQSIMLGGGVFKMSNKLHFVIYSGLFLNLFMKYLTIYAILARIIMPRNNHKRSREIFIREAQSINQEEFDRWLKLLTEIKATAKRHARMPISAPTLVVMGGQDHMFLEPAKQYKAKFQEVTLKIIKKCGHVCNIERADEFNQHCLNFLSGITSKKAVYFDAKNVFKTKEALLLRCYQQLVAFTPQSLEYSQFLWLSEKLNVDLLTDKTKRLIKSSMEKVSKKLNYEEEYPMIDSKVLLENLTHPNLQKDEEILLRLENAKEPFAKEEILLEQLVKGNFTLVSNYLPNADLSEAIKDNIQFVAAIEHFRRGSVDKSFAILNSLEDKVKNYASLNRLLLGFEGRLPWLGYPYA